MIEVINHYKGLQNELRTDIRHECGLCHESPIIAMCDICGMEVTATASTLRHCGWTLGKGQQICGRHD